MAKNSENLKVKHKFAKIYEKHIILKKKTKWIGVIGL